MAHQVKFDDLTPAQISKIYNALHIKAEEKTPFYMKKLDYTPNNKPVIEVYLEDKTTRTINLPFMFSKLILKPEQIISKKWPKSNIKNYPLSISLREDKEEVISQVLEIMTTTGASTVQKPPGAGKTIIAAEIARRTGLVTLVIVPKKPIAKQWVKTFADGIPQIKDKILLISGKKIIDDPEVIISLPGSLSNLPKEILNKVGLLILDEAHMLCTPTGVKAILSVTPKYILAETATLGRNDSLHKIMYAIAGEKGIVDIPNKPHTVVHYFTGVSAEPEIGPKGPSFGSLQTLLSQDEKRNSIWLELLKNNPHKKFLTLTYLAEHSENLYNLAKSHGLNTAKYYGNIDSYQDSFCLIGTISKIGTGFDEANNCSDFKGNKSNVLVLMTSIKVDIKLKKPKKNQKLNTLYTNEDLSGIGRWEQIKGRLRCDDPLIIYFVDQHPIVKRHAKGGIGWIEQTGGEVIKWDHDDEEPLILP